MRYKIPVPDIGSGLETSEKRARGDSCWGLTRYGGFRSEEDCKIQPLIFIMTHILEFFGVLGKGLGREQAKVLILAAEEPPGFL